MDKIIKVHDYLDSLPEIGKVLSFGSILIVAEDLNKKELVSFLLAEQNTTVALKTADFGYILENGRVVMEGTAKELSSNEDVKEFYLGLSDKGRKSFKDTKHYRRRKRWLT